MWDMIRVKTNSMLILKISLRLIGRIYGVSVEYYPERVTGFLWWRTYYGSIILSRKSPNAAEVIRMIYGD